MSRSKAKHASTRTASKRPSARPRATARPRASRSPRESTRPRPIRVLIADAQIMDRRGMAGLLDAQPEFEVIADVGSIAEAIAQFRLHSPDVLILSLGLRGPEDEPPMRAVRNALPGAHVLALSERGFTNCLVLNPPGSERGDAARCDFGTDCLQLAVAQGANGTLRRSGTPDELFEAVRAIGRGQFWHEAATAEALTAGPMRPGSSPQSLGLSDRELDVAELLAAGKSNKEISERLVISEPTVKKHIGRVLLKLGVADRLQAGLFVARHPLLLRRESSR